MSVLPRPWKRMLAASAIVLAAFGWSTLRGSSAESTSVPAQPEPTAASASSPVAHPASLGINSCMATSCHGSRSSDAPTWQQAGRIWFERDPHAQSYTNLLTESSLRIAERLTQVDYKSVHDKCYLAFLEEKCVSCHSSQSSPVEQRVLGADCQVCHGPTEAWDSKHYSVPRNKSNGKRFDNPLMLNTHALSSRTQICLSCHVGDLNAAEGSREVNHDLMAAGHPPMHFEMETFWNAYPAHWNRDDDKKYFGPTVALQRWRFGQLNLARSRLRMLSARAERIQSSDSPDHVWPELGEYSCYSCHRSLRKESFDPELVREGRSKNRGYDWDAWTLYGLRLATKKPDIAKLDVLVKNLKGAVEQRSPNSDRSQAAADELLLFVETALAEAPSSKELTHAEIRDNLRSLSTINTKSMSWEAATQWLCATRVHLIAAGFDTAAIDFSFDTDRSKQRPFFRIVQQNYFDYPDRFQSNFAESLKTKLADLLRKTQP